MRSILHIVPNSDLREHLTDEGGQCHCKPTVTLENQTWLIQHRAYDSRK